MNSVIELEKLSKPFSESWEHVQGPGGNVSVKEQELMLIKASGYTFKDISYEKGIVFINYSHSADLLKDITNHETLESPPVVIEKSIPDQLKPSMEFEFHAILKKYVLHTHSVYVNIITCSDTCESLLNDIFPDTSFELIPYTMPGHPLAVEIYRQNTYSSVIFLKNHGVIVHGDTPEEVLNLYNLVENRIIEAIKIPTKFTKSIYSEQKKTYQFDDFETCGFKINIKELRDEILVPDQSIIFKNKISDHDPGAQIFINNIDKEVTFNGSDKFNDSAFSMINFVTCIRGIHKKHSMRTDFIEENELEKLHGLSSEKYRKSIL